MSAEIRHTEICECDCHKDGMLVMHCAPCCNLTYEKYISRDGEVDIVRWAKAERERTKRKR